MSRRDDRMWALGRSVGRVLTELGRELILAAQEQEAESLAPPTVGEREMVVRWLNRQAGAQPSEKASVYVAAADAIKAGHHIEEFEQERVATRAPFPNADDPDLAQAPTTPGAGPVPLFLQGEDPEEEVFLDQEGNGPSKQTEEQLRDDRLNMDDELRAQADLDAKIDSDRKFEQDLAYVAPEQWNAEDARRLERIYQERGDVLTEQTRRRCNQLLGRVELTPETLEAQIAKGQRDAFDALQAEAKRLNEQERRGG